jgi:tetratricopeptide (TPR) repeat protein
MKAWLVSLASGCGALLGLAVVSVSLSGGKLVATAALAQSEAPPRATKDRLPEDRLAEFVKGPMELFRAGRVAEAHRVLEKLVAEARERGDRVRAADLLTAYGVALYSEGDADAPGDTRRAAIPWLERAVTATREAWGPKHPETALALQDLADVLRKISPDAPPPEAELALREAYAIRRQALGPENGETLLTMAALADVLSAGPANSSRYAEAGRLYSEAIRGLPAARVVHPLAEEVRARMGLARLHARAGRTAEALSEFERARDEIRSNSDPNATIGACFALIAGREQLVEALEQQGASKAARAASQLLELNGGLRCLTGKG